jgi:hypothetical protein
MALRLNPVEHADWTHRYADAVSVADILIQRHLGSMDPQFFRGFGFTSDFVTIVFACYGFFHEVWVYWHVELHLLLQIDIELSYLCFAEEVNELISNVSTLRRLCGFSAGVWFYLYI